MTLRNGTVALEDVGSINGTKVNDKTLEPSVRCRLREGDKVAFGKITSLAEADHIGLAVAVDVSSYHLIAPPRPL